MDVCVYVTLSRSPSVGMCPRSKKSEKRAKKKWRVAGGDSGRKSERSSRRRFTFHFSCTSPLLVCATTSRQVTMSQVSSSAVGAVWYRKAKRRMIATMPHFSCMNHWNCRLEISVIKADRNLAATAEVTFQMRFSGAFPPHGGGGNEQRACL